MDMASRALIPEQHVPGKLKDMDARKKDFRRAPVDTRYGTLCPSWISLYYPQR